MSMYLFAIYPLKPELTFTAQAIDVQGVKFWCKTGYLQIVYTIPQCSIFYFPHRSAFGTNQVLMRIRQYPHFILHRLGTQLMTHNQTSTYQHIQCIVESGFAYMKIYFFQLLIELAHIKMSGKIAYTFKYSISLLSPT